MKKVLVSIIVIMGVALYAMYEKYTALETEFSLAMANIKAYDSKLDSSNKRAMALQITAEQLESSKDSILQELNKTRRELKIKDKNLKALQHVNTVFTKSDTIYLPDTLFKDPELKVDTLIGDRWYSVHLELEYPGSVYITPEFTSNKNIVVSMRKETVKPPKKFFLLRWFQKKHKVLQVDVLEGNPYIREQKSTYIEIIK